MLVQVSFSRGIKPLDLDEHANLKDAILRLEIGVDQVSLTTVICVYS